MMKISAQLKAVCIAGLFTIGAACQSSAPTVNELDGDIAEARQKTAYILGTGDQLRVTVFGQDDISGEYEIDGSGFIAMPLIGEVQALGETTPGLKAAITTRLADGYLRDPNVSIEVMNYRPFYILGEVSTPGEYDYTSGLSVLKAVAAAGGFTYRANRRTVFITPFEETEELAVSLESSLQVLPGDTIRIGERLF